MKKLLMKLFCPSADSLAGYAADAIQKSVNASSEDVKFTVAKYSAYAYTASEIANKLSAMTKDGRIDAMERDELVKMLAPLFEKALALV